MRYWIMDIGDVTDIADRLDGVRRTAPKGLVQWRYHGRLVARQLDDTQLVIRADFDYRDAIVRQFPAIFGVPGRFRKHMMVVADLTAPEAGPIEDALVAAWELQRAVDQRHRAMAFGRAAAPESHAPERKRTDTGAPLRR